MLTPLIINTKFSLSKQKQRGIKMKVILKALALSLALTSNAYADSDLANPDHYYEIDTWGSNSEVYEITPRSNQNKRCVIFILDDLNGTSMECFDAPKTDKK